eukprot:scaffold534447_cov42-Prasinocladus_malaysianus.AAC.1
MALNKDFVPEVLMYWHHNNANRIDAKRLANYIANTMQHWESPNQSVMLLLTSHVVCSLVNSEHPDHWLPGACLTIKRENVAYSPHHVMTTTIYQ